MKTFGRRKLGPSIVRLARARGMPRACAPRLLENVAKLGTLNHTAAASVKLPSIRLHPGFPRSRLICRARTYSHKLFTLAEPATLPSLGNPSTLIVVREFSVCREHRHRILSPRRSTPADANLDVTCLKHQG